MAKLAMISCKKVCFLVCPKNMVRQIQEKWGVSRLGARYLIYSKSTLPTTSREHVPGYGGKKKKGTHNVKTIKKEDAHRSIQSYSPLTSFGIAFNATSRVTYCDSDSGRVRQGRRWGGTGEVGEPHAEVFCVRGKRSRRDRRREKSMHEPAVNQLGIIMGGRGE